MLKALFPNGIGTRAFFAAIFVMGLLALVGVLVYALIWVFPNPEMVGELAGAAVSTFNASVALAVGFYFGNRDKAVNGQPAATPAGGSHEARS